MTKETSKRKPKNFLEAVKMLMADDIAAGDFELHSLKARGKYGRATFTITSKDENEPNKKLCIATSEPGEHYVKIFIVDDKNGPYDVVETWDNIYQERFVLDTDTMRYVERIDEDERFDYYNDNIFGDSAIEKYGPHIY